MNAAQRAALTVLTQQAKRRADPLAGFSWPSPKHARWAGFIGQRVESSLRAANQAAKTYSGAAVAVALMRGLTHLDGVRLPNVPIPNIGGVLVPSHEQQVESSQSALFHWIGEWPHDVAWHNQKAQKASLIHVATRWCKHGTDDHCNTCSRLKFWSQESPDSVLGQRGDWWWSDEPYAEAMWREIRKNCRYRWITWTPLEQSIWDPIERDFGAVTDTEPVGGRVQIVAGLKDNKFLSDERKRELIESYRGDPFALARETGELVDAEGATPWGDLGMQRLQEKLQECREPEMWEFALAAAHRSAEKVALLEVFWECERDEEYYADLDGSLGISDDGSELEKREKKRGRDPSGMHIYARRRPRLVARYSGYLTPEVLGHFAAKASRMYKSKMLVDVENQGGFGEAVLNGLHNAGYTYVVGGNRLPSQARGVRALSYPTNDVTRSLYIGAAQSWNLHGGIEMPSREVIRSMLRMRVDKSGKILARNGMHDEDVILLGRAAYWLARNPPDNVPRETLDESPIARSRRIELERARSGPDPRRLADDAWE